MESPSTPSNHAPSKPVINDSLEIDTLTTVQKNLLAQHFYNHQEIYVEKKFDSGYSGATPYLISFKSNHKPVVAKFDHPVILRREKDAYDNNVKNRLSYSAPNTGELKESEDGTVGLLVYSYVGANIGEVQSFDEYLTTKGGSQAVSKLDIILDELSQPPTESRISRQKYYDRLLPPHFHLTAIKSDTPFDAVLQAGQIKQAELEGLAVGQIVQIKGFKVYKSAADGLTIYDNLPTQRDAAPIRIRLKGVAAAPGSELPDVNAVVTATRLDLLDTFCRVALPTFNGRIETFVDNDCVFPNPIHYLKQLMEGDNERFAAKTAISHGDFHFKNVLVDKRDNPWLIDFAKTTSGPILFDLQYLEARILTTLLCNDAIQSNKAVQLLHETLSTLQREALPSLDDPDSIKVTPGLNQNAYIVLVGIRRRVRTALIKETEWTEYYRGLTLALLQILKFEDYSQRAKLLALIGAAVTLQWAGLKEVKSVHGPTRPLFRWKLNMLLGVLCVFAVLGWYYFPDLWGTSIVTSKPVFSIATPVAGCKRDVDKIGELGTPALGSSILQRVNDRGVLLCGVEGGLPNFSYIKPDEPEIPGLPGFFANASGIDADFCRVVATSVFGDYHGRVAFTKLATSERFSAILNGKIDLLVRNTTWTAGRDISLGSSASGIDFGPVIFHDGQKFLVRDEEPIRNLADLKDKRVCVQRATTTYTNTLALSNTLGLNLEFPNEGNFKDTLDMISQFAFNRICDAVAGDTSQLVARVDGLSEDKIILRIIPGYPISYEPLAPAFISGDNQWREIINYAVWTTIYAEEIGVTQENIDDAALDTSDSVRQRFKDTLVQIGPQLQLREDYLGNIVRKLGNYGEIYACNLRSTLLDRGPNQPFIKYDAKTQSWLPNPGGRLFAPPFVPN